MSDFQYFEAIFKTSPSPNLVLLADSPRFTIVEVNECYCRATQTVRNELLNKGVFEAFPANPDDRESEYLQKVKLALQQVIETKGTVKLPTQKYDISVRGTEHFQTKYWSAESTPVLNDQGEVVYIIHSPVDLTDQLLAEHKERKATEELAKNQEHYHSLFNNNPDAVFSFALDGTFLSANDQLASLAECSLKELMKITFVPFVAPEDSEMVFNYFKKAGAGEIQNYNTGMITAKGKRLVVNVTNIPIIVNREIVGVYGIAKDITHANRADQELKESREQLQKIMDFSADVICIINEDKRFVKVSKASFSIWGYLPEELEGMQYTQIIYGKTKADMGKRAGSLRSGKEISNVENQYIRKDGEIITMSWSAYWDDSEKLAYCVGRDITESKAANESIKNNEKRFRTLLQNGTDGLALINEEENFLEISERGTEIFGYRESNIIGQTMADLIHPEDLDAIRQAFLSVLTNPKTPISLEYRLLSPDSTYKWIEARFQNQFNEPSVGAMVMNFWDVTDRKHYTSAIEIQNQKLRDIAWTQSHVVRAPLSRIMGLIDLINNYPAENEKELLECLSTSAVELDGAIREIVKKTEEAGV